MALQRIPGMNFTPIGAMWEGRATPLISSLTYVTIDATNEAAIFIGHWVWEDGGSHTIDTSGSSRVQFYIGTRTFSNASTTMRVGFAPVNQASYPPRATASSDVVTFDVYNQKAGNSGGINSNSWHSLTPTSGTKTIAHGDLVAFAVQFTARGGTDSVQVGTGTLTNTDPPLFPFTTAYTASTYSAASHGLPICRAVASDGTVGTFFGGHTDYSGGGNAESVSTSTNPDEVGSIFQLPFPATCIGFDLALNPGFAGFAVVLYGDPLGTPAALATRQFDDYSFGQANLQRAIGAFATPVELAANTDYVLAVKPDSTTALTFTTYNFNTNAIDIFPLSGNFRYASANNGGAFTASTSKYAPIVPLFGAFSDGVASSPVGQVKSFGRGAPY